MITPITQLKGNTVFRTKHVFAVLNSITSIFSFLLIVSMTTHSWSQVAPCSIVCPPNLTVACGSPAAAANLTQFTSQGGSFTGNCGTGSSAISSTDVNNLGNPRIVTRTYKLTDLNDTMRTCIQLITIQDVTVPEIVCKGIEIEIASSTETIPAASFINTISDACPYTVTAMRMTTGCGSPASFSPNVLFCCNDVNTTVQVMIRVTDSAGNSSTCMSTNQIKDKLPPVIEMPLRDLTISCDYPLNLSSLGVFGKYVITQNARDTVKINDFYFNQLAQPVLDGWVADNCVSSLTLTTLPIVDQRGPHKYGNIIRKFVVTDNGGNSIMLSQTITIKDNDLLTLADITWPKDTSYTDCSAVTPSTSITGSPSFPPVDVCTLPAASYIDQIFDDPTSGCKYIRRTWKVIDWSQFVPNTTIGVWEHIQNIHLVNNIKPTFVTRCENKTICIPNDKCDGVIKHGVLGQDDCTATEDLYYHYDIDFGNNGSIDATGKKDTFNLQMQRGVHAVTWQIEDRCGNISTCNYLLTVKECKAPNIICLNGLSTNLEGNVTFGATIWAKDFNNHSFDNCTTPDDLVFSFSSDINDTSKPLNCTNKNTNVNVTVFATDKDGNQSKCNTFIMVTDNKNLCPLRTEETSSIRVAGKITTDDNINLRDVKINIIKDDELIKQLNSDKDGNFSLDNLVKNQNYMLKPNNNIEWMNGISTMDLLLIQRHILGLGRLNTPYKLIAADVNNDEKINATDLVLLRKLILGITTDIPGNESWRFINKNVAMADTNHPWPLTSEVKFDALAVDKTNADFIGIKTGDVNGTVSVQLQHKVAENRSVRTNDLKLEDAYFEEGKHLNIPFVLDEERNISGLQLGLDIDVNNLDFVGVMNDGLSLSDEDFHYNKSTGKLKIAYANNKQVNVKNGGDLFVLQLKAKKNGRLSESLSLTKDKYNQQIIDETLKVSELNIRYHDGIEALSVSQNSPNPFNDFTDVKFFIAEASKVEFKIYNNAGIEIYNNIKEFPRGLNQIRVDADQLGNSKGVFFLHIATGERKEIKKLLRVN
jgi:hypothetical protein